MTLVLSRQQREADDRERERRQLVPDAGDGNREPDWRGGEAP